MISILIPVYNEKENIVELVNGLVKSLAKTKERFEIVFIDDNSPDGTGSEIKKLMKTHKQMRLLSRPGKLGLASAIMDGLKTAKGNKIVIIDADLSHPPEKVPELIKALDAGCDIAIGSRHVKGGGVENWPAHRRIISIGATTIARITLGISASDPMSGFFAIRRSILEQTKISVKGYKILMDILAKQGRYNAGNNQARNKAKGSMVGRDKDNRKTLKICEIPYIFKDRRAGQTKLGNKEIIAFVTDILRVKIN